jgi:enoyl-CoA hydratase/carnithine racemase
LFTGDLMTAAEAERIGLINHVVPADQLDESLDKPTESSSINVKPLNSETLVPRQTIAL